MNNTMVRIDSMTIDAVTKKAPVAEMKFKSHDKLLF